jgi:hypothetical protein
MLVRHTSIPGNDGWRVEKGGAPQGSTSDPCIQAVLYLKGG